MRQVDALPVCGTAVRLRVAFVDVGVDSLLVRLWGSYDERKEEYELLASDIESATKTELFSVQNWAPSAGELCVAEVNGHLHRCRVLRRQVSQYQTFLLDLGCTVLTGSHQLKAVPHEVFNLPPRVIGYVVSNLVAQEQKSWSGQALEYLSSLRGQDVDGVIEDLILPHGIVLLEVPTVSKKLLDLGLTKPLPGSTFHDLLNSFLTPDDSNSQQSDTHSALTKAYTCINNMANQPWPMDFFYPHLQVGVTEPVLVTQVSNPQHIFCQLRSLSHEVQRISDSMNHFYELQNGGVEPTSLHPLVPGQPCACRGSDGRWYRSLLQEYYPDKCLAMVIHVDWGRRDIVSKNCLRFLAADYFRMPVVTFPCSLYGVSDGGTGWDPPLIFELRSLLQGRPLSAKIEFYNSYEHLYVITLFGDDGLNINCVYGMRAQALSMRQVKKPVTEDQNSGGAVCISVKDPPKIPKHFYIPSVTVAELKVGTFYDALVEFVHDPSNFWIMTEERKTKYNEMMESMTALYSQASKLQGIIAKPQKGQLCCIKFKDNQYYRAEVISIQGKLVEVYLIDHGNTEMVDWPNVKKLPVQFRGIPGLAIRCCVADLYPLKEEWSAEAILAFNVAVVDKKLVIYVVSKETHKYVLEVLDQSRIKERSVGKILATAGHAKYEELEQPSDILKLKGVERSQTAQPVSHEGILTNTSCKTPQKETNDDQVLQDNVDNLQYSPFDDQFFEPGTAIDVVVSYIESPGLFWCQNAVHLSKLKALMVKIQDYCENTNCPYESGTSACLAKSPVDRKWYRAFITMDVSAGISDSENVEVLYVDYGMKGTVPLKDLCCMKSEFFELKAQAFKCSVYNLICPVGDNPFNWDKKATASFHHFVDKASKKSVDLKCMFFATASFDNELFNIVDVFTPFSSICHLLVESGFATKLSHRTLSCSVQLHSYYYSMHDIKIGSEEEIYITHITDNLEFYCQLSRNSKTLDMISSAITRFCNENKQSESLQSPGPLYLAKFSDEQWYRALISSSKNSEVVFVDFGNTGKVVKGELLPIPRDAHDLLLFPMQAIKCSLSDIPKSVPDEVVSWFENIVLDKALRALIVAKETDGKLIVELYNGKQQVNSALQAKLNIRGQKNTDIQTSNNVRNNKRNQLSNIDQSEIKDSTSKIQVHSWQNKESPGRQSVSHNGVFHQKVVSSMSKAKEFSSDPKPNFKSIPRKSPTLNENKSCALHIPLTKLSDLPKRYIIPGLILPVYVSHINTVLDFYVQIAEDALLGNISDLLNNEKSTSEALGIKDVNLGDLVCGFFKDDELYYRAVIKEKHSDVLHVQYIDYGNTSVIPVCKTYRLPPNLPSVPAMSICCTLSKLNSLTCLPSADDLLMTFSERTCDIQLSCEFVQQQGCKWEIILRDKNCCINDLLAPTAEVHSPENKVEVLNVNGTENIGKNIPSMNLLEWSLPQLGQTVEAYVSAVDSPEHFWCQLASSEIDSLAIKIQEAGEQSTSDADFRSVIEIGSPCNVMYSVDDNWYRAIVTKIEADLATVRFIDYGNEEIVNKEQIQPLTTELTTIPVQAFPCCLDGFNISEGCWSSEGHNFFYEKVTEDKLEITLLEIKGHGTCKMPLASVTITYKGENINSLMKQFWQAKSTLNTVCQEPLNIEKVVEDDFIPEMALNVSVNSSARNVDSLEEKDKFGVIDLEESDRGFMPSSVDDQEYIPAYEENTSETAWLPAENKVQDVTFSSADNAEDTKNGYLLPETCEDYLQPCLELAPERSNGLLYEDVEDEEISYTPADSLLAQEESWIGFGDDSAKESVTEDYASEMDRAVLSAADYIPDLCSEASSKQEMQPRKKSCSVESLIRQFQEKMVITSKDDISEELAVLSPCKVCPVLPDSANDDYKSNVCEPEDGDLQRLENKDLPVYTESAATEDSASDIYKSDVCKLEAGDQESLDNEDLSVNAESSVPEDSSSDTYMSDVCEMEASDLENLDNQDLSTCTVCPELVDSTTEVYMSDGCDSEPGTGHLQNLENQDLECPVTASNATDTYKSDVCKLEAVGVENVDNQDVSTYMAYPALLDSSNDVYKIDACEPGDGDLDVQPDLDNQPGDGELKVQPDLDNQPGDGELDVQPDLDNETGDGELDVQPDLDNQPGDGELDVQPDLDNQPGDGELDVQPDLDNQPRDGELNVQPDLDNQPGDGELDVQPDLDNQKGDSELDVQPDLDNQTGDGELDVQPDLDNQPRDGELDVQPDLDNQTGDGELDVQPDLDNQTGDGELDVQPDLDNQPGDGELDFQPDLDNQPRDSEVNVQPDLDNQPGDGELDVQPDLDNQPRDGELDVQPDLDNQTGDGELDVQPDLDNQTGDCELDVQPDLDNQPRDGELDVQPDLNIQPGDGDLDVQPGDSDLDIQPDLDAQPGGSDLDAQPGGGNLDVQPGGGDLHIQPGDGELDVQPGGGELDVQPGGGELDVQPGGGELDVQPGGGELDVQPGGGELDVQPGGGELDVQPGGGELDVQPDLDVQPGDGVLDAQPDLEVQPGGVELDSQPDLEVQPGGIELDAQPDLEVQPGGGELEVQPGCGELEVPPNLDIQPGVGKLDVQPGGGDLDVQPGGSGVDVQPGGGKLEVQPDLDVQPGGDDLDIQQGGDDLDIQPDLDVQPGGSELEVQPVLDVQSGGSELGVQPGCVELEVQPNLDIQPGGGKLDVQPGGNELEVHPALDNQSGGGKLDIQPGGGELEVEPNLDNQPGGCKLYVQPGGSELKVEPNLDVLPGGGKLDVQPGGGELDFQPGGGDFQTRDGKLKVLQNQVLSMYTEHPVTSDSTGDIYKENLANQDLSVYTAYPVYIEVTDEEYKSDVCVQEAAALQSLEKQDFSVNTDTPVHVDTPCDVCKSDAVEAKHCDPDDLDLYMKRKYTMQVDNLNQVNQSNISEVKAVDEMDLANQVALESPRESSPSRLLMCSIEESLPAQGSQTEDEQFNKKGSHSQTDISSEEPLKQDV